MNIREIQWENGEWFSRVSFDGGKTWPGDWQDVGSCDKITPDWVNKYDKWVIYPPS